VPAGKLKSGAKIKPGSGLGAKGGAEKAGKAGGTDGLFAAFLALAQSIQNKESSTQKLKDKSLLSKLAGTAAGKGLATTRGAAGHAPGTQGPGQGLSVEALMARSGSEAANKKAEIEAVKATVKAKALAEGPEPADKAGKDSEAAVEKAEKAKPSTKNAQAGLELLLAHARAEAKPPQGGEAARPAADTSAKALASANEAKAEAPKLHVSDLRKHGGGGKEAGKAEDAAAAQLPQDASAGPGGNVADLDLDLSKAAALKASGGGGGDSPDSGGAAKAGPAPAREFTSVLTEQLKAAWNGDIVKTAHIVLRDGDAGMIRLRLHPESLGGVKIELKLADNCISGRITVESDEAKTAFERNMGQLQDAFRQGGFESARLDVQVGSGQTGTAGGQGGEGPKPFWSERRGLESLGAAVPEGTGAGWTARSKQAVDILA
jgi:flagellar hook-length control protein FliK